MYRFSRPLLALSLLLGAATVASAQESAATAPAAEATVTLTAEERARYVGIYEVETPEGTMAIHIFEQGADIVTGRRGRIQRREIRADQTKQAGSAGRDPQTSVAIAS